MSFVHRKIRVSFGLGQGQTGESGTNTVTVEDKRVSCRVVAAGTDQMVCSLQLYGLTKSLMNQLANVGAQAGNLKKNTVLVEAGDSENGMNVVFQGDIIYSWPDFQSAPQVVHRIEAKMGAFTGVKPADPTSFDGDVKIETVIKTIAGKMGMIPQINGNLGTISNPYFYGAAMAQMKALASAGRFAWVADNQNILAAWPFNSSRGAGTAGGGNAGGSNLISKDTGMVGSPIGTPTGVLVKQIFSKPKTWGTSISIQSENIPEANGSYTINRVDYSLESEMPKGEWFNTFDCYKKNGGGGG
ncbi:MAG: hypothetical protein JSS57_07380 [Proteobacteria bacterium]|nr:hypothetical protein [Pseudomonadota bacterium]